MMKFAAVLVAGMIASAYVPPSPTGPICDPSGSPRARNGIINTNDYHFRYESDTGQERNESKTWCYTRNINNRHKTNNLRYEWKAAGLFNSALPPNETDLKEFNSRAGYEEKVDSIFFGVERSVERARMYVERKEDKEKAQPPSSNLPNVAKALQFAPLRSRVRIVTVSTSGRKLVLELRTESSVKYILAKNMWGYDYSLKSEDFGFGDSIIRWTPISSDYEYLSPDKLLTKARSFPSGVPSETSTELQIYDLARQLLARVTILAYIPKGPR